MRDSFCRALPILLLGMAMTGMGQSAVPQGPAPGKMINVYGHKLHIIVPGRKTGNLWLSSRLAVEPSPKIGKLFPLVPLCPVKSMAPVLAIAGMVAGAVVTTAL